MRFSSTSRPVLGRALDTLIATDQIASPARVVAGALALLGLILSGLYLRHGSAEGIIPYGAVRGLHWLLGMIIVIDSLWRLGKVSRGMLMGAAHRQWPEPPVPGGRLAYVLVAVGYWATLSIVIVTGIAAFLESRYGFSILPSALPLPWAKVHSLAFFYLPGFLLLRVFYWSRTYLKEILPYLRSP